MSGNRRIVCFGEMLLRLATPRGTMLRDTNELQVYVGGAEANVALALAHFGHRSAMISVVADTATGALCVSELARHRVDTGAVRTAPGRMGLYFLERGAGLRPARVLYDREQSAFARAMVQGMDWDSALEGVGWLHVSGITAALSAEASSTLLAGVRAARERRIRVSFDCNYRPSLWQARSADAGAILREIAACAEVLFANAHDLALILGSTPGGTAGEEVFEDLASAAMARFASVHRIATTTRVERAADDQELSGLYASRDGVCRSHTYMLRDIVERIGSGDAFAAGVLHGVLSDFELQRTVEFATAAACLKHSVAGDFSVASVADVEALVRGETTLTR